MSRRILVVGIDARHERVETCPFHADVPFTHFSHVVVDPAAVTAMWRRVRPEAHGRLVTNAETDGGLGRTVLEVVRRRRRETAELLRAGGTLLCVLRAVGKPFHVRRRSRRGPVVSILHAYSWLPADSALSPLVISADGGDQVRPADEEHLAWQLLGGTAGTVRYEAYVANEQLDPAWHVVATDRVGRPVAIDIPVGAGRAVLIPPVAGADPRERGARIAQAFAPPPPPPEPTPRPRWLADYLLPGEAELAAQVPELEEQIENLQAELDDVRARHAELALYSKLLYAAQPQELAEPVAAAFRLMGFEAEPAEPQCLDLRSEEGDAAVALAATDGPIDSDPYWVLLKRLEAEGAPAKGIIVGNPHCSTSPQDRGSAFTDLLHRGAVHREMALLATTELHAVVAALLRRPYDDWLRSRLRRGVLDAVGPSEPTALLPRDEE
ncbi:MAG: hypothetical protein ACLF0G_08770 [Candidatus Brocadiia bacterium]